MQLEDVLALAATEGARRHVEKHAGVALPLAVGAQLPDIAKRSMRRYEQTVNALEGATEQPFKTGAEAPAKMAAPLNDLLMGLQEAAPVVGRHALMGAVPGAISGAVVDSDDRGRGALHGALAGGAFGALAGGGAHAHRISGMPDRMYGGQYHDVVDRTPFTSQYHQAAPFKTAALPGMGDPLAWLRNAMSGAGGRAAGAAGRGAGALGNAAASAGSQMLGGYPKQNTGTKMDPGSGLMGAISGLGASPIEGVSKGVSGGIGDLIKKKILGTEFGDKKDPFHMGAGAAISSFGKEMGTTGADLLRDMAAKAMESAEHAGDEAARTAILGELRRTDSVLKDADPKVLMEAYHTMSRFAPVLSTDKNAVRSFLRQAVMSGSGPDYMSIGLLAKTEADIAGDKRK